MVLSLFSSFLHQGRRGTFAVSADGLSPCVSCTTGRTLPVCTLPTLSRPVSLYGLACFTSGVRCVTLTPLTPGET
nr:MAG TPA: hypothetical protein [Caudoviricetes sp.]